MTKRIILTQILICTMLGACVSQPPKPTTPMVQSQPPVLTVSLAIAPQLKAAQDAMRAGNYADGLEQARALESAPNLTPFDVHFINELLGYGFAHDGQSLLAADYLERGLTDGFLPEGQRPARVIALATLNYQLRNYAKAVNFGTLAVKEGAADEKTYVVVSQAYYLQGDYRATATFTSEHVDDLIARHEVPSESALQVILSSCAKLADASCEVYALENLIKYHPTAQYRSQLDAVQKGRQ
jgi:hypothetical protein